MTLLSVLLPASPPAPSKARVIRFDGGYQGQQPHKPPRLDVQQASVRREERARDRAGRGRKG